jgi:catechol 2,3-dioxygenase-like lactoylglutathione lyase family enzyme
MKRRIAHVALLVPGYDEAIAFYVDTLSFDLVEDTPLGGGKRWVLVRPAGQEGAALLLAEASGPLQQSRIGSQTGDRVGFFLFTDDFARDHRAMSDAGVTFLDEPRHEDYGTVAVFADPFGNKWDLLQPAGG